MRGFRHTPEMIELEQRIVEDYYINGLANKEVAEKYDIKLQRLYTILDRFDIVFDFNTDNFFKKLRFDYLHKSTPDFIAQYEVGYKVYHSIDNCYFVSRKNLILMIKRSGVPYKLKVQRSRKKTGRSYYINIHGFTEKPIKITKRERSYKMTENEKQDYTTKIKIVENHRKALDDLLHEKGLSAELKSRIVSIANVIARESMLVGIQSAKNGYSDKLEFAIMKKMGVVG